MDKSINQLAKEIHENAVAHGWWDNPRTFLEIVALCHSELSEAVEAYRDGDPTEYYSTPSTDYDTPGSECAECDSAECDCHDLMHTAECPHAKPEGVAVEMADCIIRILDWCGREDINIERIVEAKMRYNQTRPYRHGGKKA